MTHLWEEAGSGRFVELPLRVYGGRTAGEGTLDSVLDSSGLSISMIRFLLISDTVCA